MTTLASCARLTAAIALVLATSACSAAPGSHGSASDPVSMPSPAPAATRTAPSAPTAPPAPSATPDDTTVRAGEPWLVYQGGTGGPARIRLVRPDGTGDHMLVQDFAGDNPDGSQQHPDWSPDGNRIAFGVEAIDGAQDLWIANADGTGARMLYDCAAPCGWSDNPAWSPDDRTIAFVSADHVGEVDSVAFVDTVDVATGEHRRVMQAPDHAWCYGPRWAPDGTRLVVECDVFATARFDEEQVMAATIGTIDTTAVTPAFEPLLPWTSFAVYPDWNPADDRIVLQVPTDVAKPFDAADLAILDVAGGEPRVVTRFGPDGGWAIQPSWTPDGDGITFVAEDVVRSHPNAATIASDGSGLQRLSDAYFRTHPRLRPTP